MTPDTVLACATAPLPNSRHFKNGVVTWGEILEWMEHPRNVKKCGNYLLGTLRQTTKTHPKVRDEDPEPQPCTGVHRSKAGIVSRSGLLLDLDSADHGLPEALELVVGFEAILHTTFSSTPEEPRYRMIIPLDREVTPHEYEAAVHVVVNMLGAHNFDPGTSQPERYMFKPSAPDPDSFQWWRFEGPALAVDDLLVDYVPEDLSAKPFPGPGRGKRPPGDLPDPMGTFNTIYSDLALLVAEYDLPYEPAGGDRWQLVGAGGVAGMGVAPGGFFYSHHTSDPAYLQACSAFDLVRIHLFSDMDVDAKPGTPINKLPSHLHMLEVAANDKHVVEEVFNKGQHLDQDDEGAPLPHWRLGFDNGRNGKPKNIIPNWRLLAENDPVVQSIRWNEMAAAYLFTEKPPWRKDSAMRTLAVRTADERSLAVYLDETYSIGGITQERVQWLVQEYGTKRSHHPVKEWLDNLPEWDGIPRVETCLPGAADTEHNRKVARKCLVAAVARVYEPGCKWDHSLILVGKEGVGKTHWIERMSNGWHAPLGPVHAKDTVQNLQGAWIATSDEGSNMRKADADALKEFLTRTKDMIRLPYEKTWQEFPRHFVIWGTTNERDFLRRQQGNRRFLIVECERKVDFETEYRPNDVQQIWAEAKVLRMLGETLFFDDEDFLLTEQQRDEFTEENVLAGPIKEFLYTPKPQNYLSLHIPDRLRWLEYPHGTAPDLYLETVCVSQVWNEALGQYGSRPITNADRAAIRDTLRELGWMSIGEGKALPRYGSPRLYARPADWEPLPLPAMTTDFNDLDNELGELL